MRRQLAPDHEIARLATAQHGIVGRRQLIALGVSAQFVDRAVQRGRLQLVHRGVYAVGHRALTIESSDITKHRNIPITTPARTIIDLARTLEGRPLESASTEPSNAASSTSPSSIAAPSHAALTCDHMVTYSRRRDR
jgi:predicted transcriptional regulator of viral defense system